ncbi:hypothetical protein [Scytonema sp. HK-05]|nr:hypothetical protein [Scytonema sp. HK-05]
MLGAIAYGGHSVRSRSLACYGWAIAPLGRVLCAIGFASTLWAIARILL